jgi:hypothetical protein
MKHCSREVHWAFFASGGIKKHRAVKVVPKRETLAQGAAPLRGERLGEIVEWHDPAGDVLARKVTACDRVEYWLRGDLAAEGEAIVAAEAAAKDRTIAKVLAWRDRTDAENAAKRGMDIDSYRKLRNAQGHRSEMRSGRNSIGM